MDIATNQPAFQTGVVEPLTIAGSPLFNAATVRKLARWESAKKGVARALIVQVASDVNGTSTFPPAVTIDEAVSLGGNPTIQPQGIGLRLNYGVGAASKEVWCDLVPGSIQLPPCEFAQVDLFQTATNSSRVAASIAVGLMAQAPVPTITQNYVFGAAGTLSIYPPKYARAVDLWADAASVGTALKVRFRADTGAQNLIETDYSTGLVVPPVRPAPFGGTEAILQATAACSVVLRYYLGL